MVVHDRARVGARILVVAVAALLIAACVPAFTGKAGGPRLAVIGDSIAKLADSSLHARLEPSYLVSVDGRNGLTIAEQLATAQEYGAQTPPPDIAVIELGTNDANRATNGQPAGVLVDTLRPTLTASLAALHQMIGMFTTATCIVIVDVNANTLRPLYNWWATEWNRAILPTVLAADPRLRIAAWSATVRQYYDLDEPDGPLTTDLVHPTAVGQRLLAGVIGDTVDACMAPPVTTTTTETTTTTAEPTTTTAPTTTTTEPTTSTTEPSTTTTEPDPTTTLPTTTLPEPTTTVEALAA